MKFGSFGRETDRAHAYRYYSDPLDRAQILAMVDAVHDLNDGTGSVENFIAMARIPARSRFEDLRNHALSLTASVAAYHPKVLDIWRELARDINWIHRFSVGSRLYWFVPEEFSDALYAELRYDRSKRVREIVTARYEWRAGPDRYHVKMYEAADFDERVRRGEVRLPAGGMKQ